MSAALKMPTIPLEAMIEGQRRAEALRDDPASLDRDLYRQGNDLLVFYSDENKVQTNHKGFNIKLRYQKVEIIQQAIHDLANRGEILSRAYLGINYYAKRTRTFICANQSNPMGHIIYKINVKNPGTLIKWQKGSPDESDESLIEAANYRLIAEWSRLL